MILYIDNERTAVKVINKGEEELQLTRPFHIFTMIRRDIELFNDCKDEYKRVYDLMMCADGIKIRLRNNGIPIAYVFTDNELFDKVIDNHLKDYCIKNEIRIHDVPATIATPYGDENEDWISFVKP